MITDSIVLSRLSEECIGELCVVRARLVLGDEAPDQDVLDRARLIHQFLYGQLPYPSKAKH